MANYASVAVKGAFWHTMSSAIQTIVRIGASTILARILDPSDFGLFGIAYLCYELFNRLTLGGMTAGLIAKKSMTEKDVTTCFWSIIFMRTMVSFLLFLFSPLFSVFFKNPNLSPVIRVVSIVFLITGIGTIPQTLLRKRLSFKKLAMIRLCGGIVESGVAVALVLTTQLKYWALVIGMVVSSSIISLLAIFFARWLPSLSFDKNSFKYLFRFGINGMGSSILSYFGSNLDYWIVGKVLGTKMLGYYEFAYRIPHIISERLSSPIGSVFFPVLASGNRNNSRLFDGYLKATRHLAWILFPCFGGLAVTAPLVVNILWGKKWLLIVHPMQVLCLAAAVGCFWWLHNGIFLAKERPDLLFKLNILQFIITGVSVYFLCLKFGFIGVAIGMVLSRGVSFVSAWMAMRMVEGNYLKWIITLLRPLCVTLLMMFTVYMCFYKLHINGISNIINLFTCIILGCFLYFFFGFVFFKKEVLELKETFLLLLK